MTTKQIMIPEQESDPQRYLLLTECEKKIASACRRGVECSREIGEQLRKIAELELWREKGSTSMTDYVEHELPMDKSSASRLMLFSRVADVFDSHQLSLPEYESQAVVLGKLKEDQLIEVWQRVKTACDRRGEPITVFAVRQAVIDQREQEPGVEVELKETATDGQRPTTRIRLNEKGEKALERVSRLCGAEIGAAIENGTVRVPQADLEAWAEQDDQTVKNLGFYVIDQRWSVNQSLKYENRAITGATAIDDLILLCRARGGRVVIDHDAESFTVRLTLEIPS